MKKTKELAGGILLRLGFSVLVCIVVGLAASGIAGAVTGVCWIVGSVVHIGLPYSTIFKATVSILLLVLVLGYKLLLDRDIL
ncbi:hypothetical protein [Bacillus cereus]|uniref:hypothetical protein n=1 Tax=Bacillus cereus TaxID=1396 RepID=UPI001C8CC845|nr:hypothetical protein [Bacillus cereus]MBX9158269.1 hypothetical protein [Bacillus cereus]